MSEASTLDPVRPPMHAVHPPPPSSRAIHSNKRDSMQEERERAWLSRMLEVLSLARARLEYRD